MGLRLQPGSTFAGDYRVIQPLGDGGMGSVYVVEQISTGARRALKLMLPHLAHDEEARQRFEREAKVGSRIASDHVVQVIASGVDEASGVPWLAMEFIEGEALDSRVARLGPLSMLEAREIFAQLGHALRAAHDAGIVHRDIKPENLHVSEGRRASGGLALKVLDFGIAKLLHDAGASSTAPIGTLAWMAPEQTEQSGTVSPATDVWSVGLLAFWALTGKSYWLCGGVTGASAAPMLRELVLEPLVPASQRASDFGVRPLPAGFDGWFAHAVARDPHERFADGGEACDALIALLVGETGATAPTVPDPRALAMTEPIPGHISESLAAARASKTDDPLVSRVGKSRLLPTSKREPEDSPKAIAARPPASRGRLGAGLGALALVALAIGAYAVRRASNAAQEVRDAPPQATASASANVSTTVNAITDLPPPACSNAKAIGLYSAALQAMRDANWAHARERLHQAAELEPTCALIQLRLTMTEPGAEGRAHYAHAVEGRAQLNARDKTLLDVWEPKTRDPADRPLVARRALEMIEKGFRDPEFYWMVCDFHTDAEVALSACQKAVEIDSQYADAWQLLGEKLVALHRDEEGLKALDRCIEVSPTTSDCRISRSLAYNTMGRCEDAEADRHHVVLSSPAATRERDRWIASLRNLHRPHDTVMEAFEQKWAILPEAERQVGKEIDLFSYAMEEGQWTAAETHLKEADKLMADEPAVRDKPYFTREKVAFLLALDRKREAARAADQYLKRRQTWSDRMTVAEDVNLFYAQFAGGLISREEFESKRATWLSRSRTTDLVQDPWKRWQEAFIPRWDDPEESARALSAKPEGSPHAPDIAGALGEVYAYSGKGTEALPLLKKGMNACTWDEGSGSFPLGLALEATGDKSAACDAFARVIARKGKDALVPKYVKEARKRSESLGCKSSPK